MVNLTAEVSLATGPLMLGTLVKHYLDRLKRDPARKNMTQLRRDELAYDEAFNVVKNFLHTCSLHTVEEVQAFANAPTPSPPWVHVVKVLIPMTCCDEAAKLLIQVLGGEEHTRKIVGGVKWWQVRGVHGIDGQWITARKDWQEAKRRYKMQQQSTEHPSPPAATAEPAHYEEDMDAMRCILYLHGGGYYFGSVDQTRYSIQRMARKINGRVFAINYRLAPQYPFPCALQDALASYLYLINPPPEAKHRPVNPAHIVISGDSAGGGMSIALLQMIRDLGLPMPAGGVLISPWTDLTHSFPSIHTNTETDVIPKYGLSLQKPSLLWPPPSQELTRKVHASLRSRVRKTMKMDFDPTATITEALSVPHPSAQSTMPINVGATASLPPIDPDEDQTIKLVTEAGETLQIKEQLHMYTENRLLKHPLVSSCLSYLGGLPPLHIIASDKEVLRDEIIYAAHKAAHPERFPVTEDIKKIYPVLQGIEDRCKATPVHLQVFDDTAHVIPILFSFTTPGKYCFRAMASFTKHVTGMPPKIYDTPHLRSSTFVGSSASSEKTDTGPGTERRKSVRQSLSSAFSQRKSTTSVSPKSSPPMPPREDSASSDVGGPRFGRQRSASDGDSAERMAGEPGVYIDAFESGAWDGTMIRERVSIQGVLRPLEAEEMLDGMKVPSRFIGQISELAIRRFIDGLDKFDKKFAHTIKAVAKHRKNNLQRATKDIARSMTLLEKEVAAAVASAHSDESPSGGEIKNGVIPSTGGWSWAWALEGEDPPPSSIASRRDTEEARRLAKIADLGFFQDEHTMTANNLWQVVINFLTTTPDKDKVAVPGKEKGKSSPKMAQEAPAQKKEEIEGEGKTGSPETVPENKIGEMVQPQAIQV